MFEEELVDQRDVWRGFAASLDAELREDTVIRGISGLNHEVQGIAVDEKTNRVVVISAESNPRIAALMQVDIQATLGDSRVIVARPIIVDLPNLAKRVASDFGLSNFPMGAITQQLGAIESTDERNKLFSDFAQPYLDPIAYAAKTMGLANVNQLIAIVQQLSQLDWPQILKGMSEAGAGGWVVPLADLLTMDIMEADRALGTCPIPLYEFGQTDWDMLARGKELDEIQHRLKQLGIYQYFYPPPDQLALGIADRRIAKRRDLAEVIGSAPLNGHPLGVSEVVSDTRSVQEIIEALTELGLLVEGELGFEVTPEGKTQRAVVKFRPREGLISKLLQRFNINISASPKDFLQ